MDSSRPPTVAEIEARNTQRARDHGYDSWEEYEDAREQREQEAYIKQIEERRKRGESDLRPIACTNLPVFEEPVPEPWYLPEKCHCKEHLVYDFCPGNLKSPVEEEEAFCGLYKTEKAALLNMKIKEGEPSRRLSDEELYRYWLYDDDDEVHPGDLEESLANDELTRYLMDQRRVSRRGGRHPLASAWHPVNDESPLGNPTNSFNPAYANQEREGSPEVGQNKSRRLSTESGIELSSHVARNFSESSPTLTASSQENKRDLESSEADQNKDEQRTGSGLTVVSPKDTTPLDSASPFRQGNKRSLNAPEAQQEKDKQRRLGSGAAVISSQSGSHLSPSTASDQSKQDTLEAPEAAQNKDERTRVESTLGVISPRNTTESVPATSVNQGQKRIRDEPTREQVPGPLNKRIRLISEVEKATQTNIIHDHRRRHGDRQQHHPLAKLPMTFPQRSSLNDVQAQVAPTSVGSGQSSQRSPERLVRQSGMPEHPLSTAGRGKSQESQQDNRDARAIVGVPQTTPQANPTTPTQRTNTENIDAADDQRHKKSKVSIWEDLSYAGMHLHEGGLGRHLGVTHPRNERAQPSPSQEEDEISDTQRGVAQVLQSSPLLDPTTPSRTTKRKTVHEPGETSTKRIRLSTEEDFAEARQLERETEQLDRGVEVARRRQRERTQRSQGHGMVRDSVQVVIEVPQSKPQAIPTTSPDHPQPDVEEESQIQAKQRGRVSTKGGARKGKTIPASVVGAARKAATVKKSKATDKKGPAMQQLSTFLEQPRRTRSKNNQVFYELGEQGRGLTHKLKRSQRTGRSW